MKQPLKAVDALLQTVEKQFGKGAMMRLGDKKAERVPCIPTGSPSLDEALGCGGYPKGRVVEIFGPESSGKTTLTLHAIAQCQAMGGVAAFIDAEHALDMHYAKNLGVLPKDLLVSQPDNGEQALDIAEILVRQRRGGPGRHRLRRRSRPQSRARGRHGRLTHGPPSQADEPGAAQARRRCAPHRHHDRLHQPTPHEDRRHVRLPETTTGGHALKYYASVRLDIRRIGAVKQGDDVLGNRTRVKVVKNKLAPPFRKGRVRHPLRQGHRRCGRPPRPRRRSRRRREERRLLSIWRKNIAQGRENARAAIEKDDKLREAIAAQLRSPAKGARKAA